MTTLYKLTTQDRKTRPGHSNETLWGENVTHTASGEGELCGPGFIHAYTHPLLAVLLNPIHADITDPLLWECEGTVAKSDHGLKVGCTSLTTLHTITVPEVTTTQHVAFGIMCAQEVLDHGILPEWHTWADEWLSGKDRTARSAEAAARAAARAAAWAEATAGAAVWAVRAATWAAAWAAEEAGEAAWAAEEAGEAARAAVWAVRAERAAALDLAAIAEKAFEIK